MYIDSMAYSYNDFQYNNDIEFSDVEMERINNIINSTDLEGIYHDVMNDINMKFGQEELNNIRTAYKNGEDISNFYDALDDSISHVSSGYNYRQAYGTIERSYYEGHNLNQYNSQINYNNNSSDDWNSTSENNMEMQENEQQLENNNVVSFKQRQATREQERLRKKAEREKKIEESNKKAEKDREEREKKDKENRDKQKQSEADNLRIVDEIVISADSKIVFKHNDKSNELYKQFIFNGRESSEIRISYEEYKSLKEAHQLQKQQSMKQKQKQYSNELER